MKEPLKWCCNGCKQPVQPPSWVLCKDCLAALSEKMHKLRDELFPEPSPCACGGVWHYIVNKTTFCRACYTGATDRRKIAMAKRDVLQAAAGASIREHNRVKRASEQHHAARGRRRSGYK